MQSILQQQGEEMCPSGAIPARGSWASRGTIFGSQLLRKHLAAHGLQGPTPHSSRQDFHTLERKICFKNFTVTKIKECFVISTCLLSQFLCCDFFFFNYYLFFFFFIWTMLCNYYPHLKIKKDLLSSQPQLHGVRYYHSTVLMSVSNVSFFF